MTIDDLLEKLENATRDEFEKRFLAAVADKTPVRTGALKAGYFWDYADARKPVFSNVEPYFPYVEFGTQNMAPHGMVGTTILEAPQILKDAIKAVGL